MVLSNAVRKTATRSTGTPGAVTTLQPMPASEFWNSRMRRPSSLVASSLTSGMPFNSGCDLIPDWNGIDTNLSLSQCAR